MQTMPQEQAQPFLLPGEPLPFRRPGPPLYAQFADLLRERIESGALAPGTKLPNMVEMARATGLARVTVRQAVQLLVLDGLLTARQGRGIHVARELPRRTFQNMRTSWSALVKRIEGASVQMLEAADTPHCPLLTAWKLPGVPEYRYMRRVHIKDGVRFAYIELYLDRSIYARAPERFDRTTVIPVMEDLKVNVTSARQELTIGSASPEVAMHLGIACSAPVALVRRYACDASGRAVYAASLVHPGDRVRFDIDLVR